MVLEHSSSPLVVHHLPETGRQQLSRPGSARSPLHSDATHFWPRSSYTVVPPARPGSSSLERGSLHQRLGGHSALRPQTAHSRLAGRRNLPADEQQHREEQEQCCQQPASPMRQTLGSSLKKSPAQSCPPRLEKLLVPTPPPPPPLPFGRTPPGDVSNARQLLETLRCRELYAGDLGLVGSSRQVELRERWDELHAYIHVLAQHLEGACLRIESLDDGCRSRERELNENKNTIKQLEYRASMRNVQTLEKKIESLEKAYADSLQTIRQLRDERDEAERRENA